MNDTPAVIVNIQRQPGANIIAVVDRIKTLLPQLTTIAARRRSRSTILTDRTNTIRASVNDVQFELMLTVALVVMVIFLFLRNVSATIIPSVAVPLSLVGTFGVMYLLGYSLNNLTLMALTISTGFVVDDAIVMIENISRYIEEGETPLQAALKGSEQIGFTIVSLTVSLIAVLIPLLFMGDIVGRLFREFAVTLSVTILISAVVSLTLTPMMCAQAAEAHAGSAARTLLPRVGARFRAVIAFYGKTLRRGARAIRRMTLLVAVGTLALTVLLFYRDPERIFPDSGYGRHSGRFRSGADRFLPGDVDAAAGAGEGDSEGSGGRQPVFVHRHRRHQYDAEQRPHPDQPEAAGRAEDQRQRRDSPPAAGAGEGVRHHALHAAGAGI